MADIDRIELLIGLSNNVRAENEAWRREVFKEGRQRAVRLREMMTRFEQEYGALGAEMDRLQQYLPAEQARLPTESPLPKAVTQGPKP